MAGEAGPAVKWVIEHQLQVGRMFDAPDMVEVSQAHMMADPESLGEAGAALANMAMLDRFADGDITTLIKTGDYLQVMPAAGQVTITA